MPTAREIELAKQKALHEKLDKILEALEELKKKGVPTSKKVVKK